jgi:hypothetical protein
MDHSYPVDFFALGVIAYEFMTGKVKFYLFRGRILEKIGNKSDKAFCQSKYNSIKSLLSDGPGRASILSTVLFKESRNIGLVTKEWNKSSTILSSRNSNGSV